jgi:type IV pilus assembly protein PilB
MELKMLGIKSKEKFTFQRGKGCEHCAYRGYKGRSGIFELFWMEDEIRRMIIAGKPFEELAAYAARHLGFITLREDGIQKIKQGITTPEEIMRVTME